MREGGRMSVHVTSNVELRNYVRLLLNVELRNYVISRQIIERARRLLADLSDRWTYGGQRSHAIG